MKYTWDFKKICNNKSIGNDTKELLLNHYFGIKDNNDKYVKDRKQYQADLFEVNYSKFYTISPILLKKILELYNIADQIGIDYNFSNNNFSNDTLLLFVRHVFNLLGSKEINDVVEDLVNPKNNYIQLLEYNDNNSICKEYAGIVVSDNDNLFMSTYLHHTLEDIPVLSHEVAHMVMHKYKIKHKDKTLKTRNSFCEIESLFMEMLANEFCGKVFSSSVYTDYLNSNMYRKYTDYIYGFTLQYALYNGYDIDKINLELGINKTFEEILLLCENDKPDNMFNYINSYLIALDLYNIYLIDNNKAINLFETIITSSDENIIDVLNDNGITYFKDDFTNYKNMRDNVLNLKQKVKGR